MGFVPAVKSAFSNYVTWKGRASRSEYWWFVLFVFIGGIITTLLDGLLGTQMMTTLPDGTVTASGAGYIYLLFILATLLPGISLAVRRLHDKDKSGWWYWIILIPLAGFIILLVWFCQRGTVGANSYGPDPLGGV